MKGCDDRQIDSAEAIVTVDDGTQNDCSAVVQIIRIPAQQGQSKIEVPVIDPQHNFVRIRLQDREVVDLRARGLRVSAEQVFGSFESEQGDNGVAYCHQSGNPGCLIGHQESRQHFRTRIRIGRQGRCKCILEVWVVIEIEQS